MDAFDRERKEVVYGVAQALRKAFEYFRIATVSKAFADEGKVMPPVAREEDIADYDAKYKVNPPLRTIDDLEAVIEGLKDGTIDVIATDHAPHTVAEKQSPIQIAPMGIAGFETALGLTLTYLVQKNKLNLIETLRKLNYNPSRILGIKNQGNIKIGQSANLTVIDLNEEWIVNASKFKSKCRISPFEGLKLKGRAKMTIINGKIYNIGQ